MELVESDMLFIDVDASTPAVKQEQEEAPNLPDIANSSIRSPDKQYEDCDALNNTSAETTDDRTKKKRGAYYKCNSCQYITSHGFLFQEHLNRHKGIKPYKCELCPYSSVSKKYAKKHQAKHKTCPCGFLSRNALGLRRHVAACGRRAPDAAGDVRRCASCDRDYVDEKALAKHRASQQACPQCARACCGAGALRKHALEAHQAPAPGAALPRKKERFECALCAWSSSQQQKILLHLIHHPQAVAAETVDVDVLKRCGIL